MRFTMAMALLGLVSGLPGAALRAQEPERERPDMKMMAMDSSRMVEMRRMEARLDSLTEVMNQASGNRRIEAIRAVVNALVEQHRAMREMMRSRMGGMRMEGMEKRKMAPADSGAADADEHEH